MIHEMKRRRGIEDKIRRQNAKVLRQAARAGLFHVGPLEMERKRGGGGPCPSLPPSSFDHDPGRGRKERKKKKKKKMNEEEGRDGEDHDGCDQERRDGKVDTIEESEADEKNEWKQTLPTPLLGSPREPGVPTFRLRTQEWRNENEEEEEERPYENKIGFPFPQKAPEEDDDDGEDDLCSRREHEEPEGYPPQRWDAVALCPHASPFASLSMTADGSPPSSSSPPPHSLSSTPVNVLQTTERKATDHKCRNSFQNSTMEEEEEENQKKKPQKVGKDPLTRPPPSTPLFDFDAWLTQDESAESQDVGAFLRLHFARQEKR